MTYLAEKYKNELRAQLKEKLGLANPMQVPKLQKIVLSCGIGTKHERDLFNEAKYQLGLIAGQQPVITKTRKNISNFKLRAGMNNGVMVTLRGPRMYDFLERLVNNTFPRVRDFRGITKKGFDRSGNYNLGMPDVTVFTEVDVDKLKTHFGLNLTFVTSAQDDNAARELLTLLGLPFSH